MFEMKCLFHDHLPVPQRRTFFQDCHLGGNLLKSAGNFRFRAVGTIPVSTTILTLLPLDFFIPGTHFCASCLRICNLLNRKEVMARAFSLALMNDSNNGLQDGTPERVDLRLNPRPVAGDARMEGSDALSVASKSGPAKEMTAASALAGLVKSQNVDDSNDEEDFEIPQRFTKSGRKKATPFPMKVSVLSHAG